MFSFFPPVTTLFSFSDIELLEDGGIPTEAFLASCYAVVPVLGKTAAVVLRSCVSGAHLTALSLRWESPDLWDDTFQLLPRVAGHAQLRLCDLEHYRMCSFHF